MATKCETTIRDSCRRCRDRISRPRIRRVRLVLYVEN